MNFRIVLHRSEERRDLFFEDWVKSFPDQAAYRQDVLLHYGSSKIDQYYFVFVDGHRYLLPLPRSRDNLMITPLQYHLGKIL